MRDHNLSNYQWVWSLVACRGVNVFILSKMGPRNWLLVGNKRWLLLGGSKCTIFVVVANGTHDLVSPERSVASRRGR